MKVIKSKFLDFLVDHELSVYAVLKKMGYAPGNMGTWTGKINGTRYLTRLEAEKLVKTLVKMTKETPEEIAKVVRAEKYKLQ